MIDPEIEFRGIEHSFDGPCWVGTFTVTAPGTGGGASVNVNLTLRADELFSQEFGDGYDGAAREEIVRNFGEDKIRQMARAGESIPAEFSITAGPGSGRWFRVTDIDAQLLLKRWGMIADSRDPRA